MRQFPRATACVALAAALLSVACDSSSLLSPNEIRRFVRAKAQWDSRPFTDYSYEVRTSCFCPPEVTAWTRVTVRNGAVVAAESVDPNPAYPITSLVYWSPIDSLFSRLYADFTGPSEWIAEIVVEYDPDLGFPTFIDRREKPTVADAASVLSLRNVRPLD